MDALSLQLKLNKTPPVKNKVKLLKLTLHIQGLTNLGLLKKLLVVNVFQLDRRKDKCIQTYVPFFPLRFRVTRAL